MKEESDPRLELGRLRERKENYRQSDIVKIHHETP